MTLMSAFLASSPLTLSKQSRPFHQPSQFRTGITTCNASPTVPPISSPRPSSTPPSLPPTTPSGISMSPRLLNFLSKAEQGNPVQSLSRAEAAFTSLKASQSTTVSNITNMVTSVRTPLLLSSASTTYDVVVAGGTLGIIYATALQRSGWRVAVVERGPLQGREQEWNISRSELSSLIQNNVLTKEQLEEIIVTECEQAGRLAFKSKDGKMREMFVNDVLNVGVAPDLLVEHAKGNFERAGGTILQLHSLTSVRIAPDCVSVTLKKQSLTVTGALGAGGTGLINESDNLHKDTEINVTSRLLIDAMGAFSPIAKQARQGRKPDGVCITVGSCVSSSKWPSDLTCPDIMTSQSPINSKRSAQYFWEAFPVGRDPTARTMYMFSYGACDKKRQTLTSALEDYIDSLREYQGVDVDNIESVKRVLFGFFPSYYKTETPAGVTFDRILPVGDAGGLQSPISFGGFGCCSRHLTRITNAVNESLAMNLVEKKQLSMIQWYLPSLAVTGLFHKAMSVEAGAKTAGSLLDEYGINDVLWCNMKAMESAGRDVQLSFLRDVVTASGLSKTLGVMTVRNPLLAVKLAFGLVGVPELVDWSRHFVALLVFAALKPAGEVFRELIVDRDVLKGEQLFWLNRLVDALNYGSGGDAMLEEAMPVCQDARTET